MTMYDLVQEKLAERKSVASPSSPPAVVNSRSQVSEPLEPLSRISRELSEVTSSGPSSLVHESLSSASSFQSLTSNLSSKSSSGICTDSIPGSPDKTNSALDHSYVNVNIPDVDDLINACANINLNESISESLDNSINNLSQDQTFASATDDTIANETQIELRLEESIQTFETCPALEPNQVSKEVSLSTSIFKASASIDKSSIIPYVSFKNSVLKRYQNESEQLNDFEFKSSLSSLEVENVETTSAPFTEVELVEDEAISTKNETIIEVNNTVDFSLRDIHDQTDLQAAETSLCVDNIKKVQVFNPIITLRSELKVDKLNDFTIQTTEISNLSVLKEASNQITENKKVKTTNKKSYEHIDEREDIVQDSKTEIIVQKTNILNKTQGITKEENFLNHIEAIVRKNSTLNNTQDIIEKTSAANKNHNSKNLQVFIQSEIQSFNNLVLVKEGKEISEHNNQVCTEKNENLKLIFQKEEIKEKKSEVLIQELVNSKKNEIKTPSELSLYVQKGANTSEPSQALLFEESRKENILNTEKIASTSLPKKNFIKEDTEESSNRKSALFTTEFPKFENEQKIIKNLNSLIKNEIIEENENNIINFDETVAINKSYEKLIASKLILKENREVSKNLHDNFLNQLLPESEYEAFKPQQQSTNLPFADSCNFQVLQEAALSVAKDIDDSLEKIEESEHYVSATTELFGDPFALDFLNQVGSQTARRGERYDSLYMKFDPLAQRQSMLPQKNLPTSPLLNEEEEKEVKVETSISNMGTPKKNPALAAIDRLLFYSPCTVLSSDAAVAEAKQKKEVAAKQEPQLIPIVDEKIAKELEFVRSTVLQLEAELEKQKQEHKEQLERQKETFEDKINHIQTKCNQMQSQLTQEVKCKDQMTVVVEEYEKSISRLIAEREKDRINFETEKVKIQEELQVANQYLSNTEAAFTDVHSKYERLKNVVSAYKSNETVLKESIAENQETIKTLENRYEQLKSHAMAQLEKANLELNAIRKHNEAETVKLKALVRKAELKSKSLEETVEQKMKENKELTQIIDEMIARVD